MSLHIYIFFSFYISISCRIIYYICFFLYFLISVLSFICYLYISLALFFSILCSLLSVTYSSLYFFYGLLSILLVLVDFEGHVVSGSTSSAKSQRKLPANSLKSTSRSGSRCLKMPKA